MAERPYFDSVNFVVLDSRCDLLSKDLKHHNLSNTQYCVLLKCRELGDSRIAIQDIAASLGISASIMTQSVNELENRKLVVRATSSVDAREKYLQLTKQGGKLVGQLEEELYASMEAVFNPERIESEMPYLMRGLHVGGQVGGIWSKEFIDQYPTSTNLTAVTIFLKSVEDALREQVGISISETRILQRLDEVGQPLRVSSISEQISLPATTITRAASRLEKKGLIQKLCSPHDRKAVYISPTFEGEEAQKKIFAILDKVGREKYWGQLSKEDFDATVKIRNLFLENKVKQETEAKAQKLSDLTPLSS